MKTMNGTLKANELMIGDWVYNPFTRKTLRLTFGRDLDLVEELCLEPIPLTGEILGKNGFERHRILDGGLMEENWKFSDDYYDITVYEWSDSIWVYRYESTEMNIPHEQRVISHVHELQHALRPCGVEKEITI